MKKVMPLLFLGLLTHNSFAQTYFSKDAVDARHEQNAKNIVSVGTSKRTAGMVYGSVTGMDGFKIKDNDIKIVGFLHREAKIEYDSVLFILKREGVVLDSQMLACNGIRKRWRDYYLTITNVILSDNYSLAAYGNTDSKLLDIRYFFIKKE